MIKTPPSSQPRPSTASRGQPKPQVQRVRTNRAQANKGAQNVQGHHEEDEPDMMKDPGSSLGHHGDRHKDASEETLRMLEESRHRDRQEFQQRSQDGDKGPPPPPVALPSTHSTGTHLSTPQAAQTGSRRALFGGPADKRPGEPPPAPGGPSATGSRPALPSSAPLTGSRLALSAQAAPPGARPELSPTGSRPALPPKMDARHLLSTGKPVGTYLKPHPPASAASAAPALQGAVQEAQALLAHVKGIEHIGTGENQTGQTVLVVAAGRGFTYDALLAVPEKVQGLPVVVSISFPNLSLRRTAAPAAGLPPAGPVNKLGR
ncbi:hypothetical protein [Stigmatella hybrida]|uniref:hypothetical protein n=1 Tax=Stigmatella hybrida TaxID=394097 RepID=UPI001CDACF60|nr:hypothetical protein [Stigmatella hybrida]